MPWLGHDVAELERRQAILVVGSHARHEQPLLAQRLRKAALAGAKISFVNPAIFAQTFAVMENIAVGNDGMVAELLAILAALQPTGLQGPVAERVAKSVPNERHFAVAASLKKTKRAGVYLGALAQAHPDFSLLRQLAQMIAQHSGATWGEFAASGNSAGAWLAGAVPHRLAGGVDAPEVGLDASAMLAMNASARLLVGIEPEYDSLQGQAALDVLRQSGFNVVLTPFMTAAMQSYAQVILPMASFAETSGTYVNTEGLWQGMRAVARAHGEARPGWKILRVVGNLLNLDDFEFMSSEEVRDAVRAACQSVELTHSAKASSASADEPVAIVNQAGLQRLGGVALYAPDGLVRRSAALQETAEARALNVRLHPNELRRQGVQAGVLVEVASPNGCVQLAAQADEGIPEGCAWIAYGVEQTVALGDALYIQLRGV
jgi:NADH-quinone oxidoreductase subunit G